MLNDIFIVHWKKLIDRKEYLEKEFGNYNINWLDFYDRDTLTEEDINNVYDDSIETWNNRVVGLYNDPPTYRNLSKPEICNSMSHIYAFKNMLINDIEYALVLEDDVRLKKDFFNLFDHYFNLTPSDFDIIFFGSAFSVNILDSVGCENDKPPIKTQNGVYVYEKLRNPKTRCVDAYILSNSTAEKLNSIIDEKISLPYDFDLAYFIKKLDLKVYWWEPGLVYQGSQTGEYRSSLR
jgi:GR25 family glycosyltransferase involved in LPS biosynthesis